jgi:lipopolysaccharide/colanic/teichoic acid biosynthesis glycosyltransferase
MSESNLPLQPNDDELLRLERRLTRPGRRQALVLLYRLGWRIGLGLSTVGKRGLDILVAGLVLILALPLMLLVALLIKLTDGGPVLFWQTRVGKWGRPFAFPKFRSMVVDAEARRIQLTQANVHGDGITFKMRRDPRVTWIGRFIRKTSIDELPQLWCVLKGEMSLVGPRPALVSEVDRYSLGDRRRLEAIPGLTCTWQVAGRSDIPFPEQLRMDVDYIERQSLGEDFKLLLKTIPAVISGRGAY